MRFLQKNKIFFSLNCIDGIFFQLNNQNFSNNINDYNYNFIKRCIIR